MTPRISNGILDMAMAMTLWPWSYHIHIHWAQQKDSDMMGSYGVNEWSRSIPAKINFWIWFSPTETQTWALSTSSNPFPTKVQWRFRNFTPNLIFSPCCSLKPQINKKSKNHGTHADPLTSGAHTERPGHRPKPWPAGKKRWGHDGCNQQSTVKHEMLIDVGYSPWLSNFRKTHDKIWQGDLGRLWGVKHLARCLEV